MTGINGANRIFYTNNAGGSWLNFTGTLPVAPVYCITYTEDKDTYVGTEMGVYFMDVSMTDWVPFFNGMPRVPVTDLFVNESGDALYASTFGRGIWQSDLYSDCGPFLLLSGTTVGNNFFQSGGFIETTQVIPGSTGNELRLRSPVNIKFKADPNGTGFTIGQGAYLHALIGPCGQGVFNIDDHPNENDVSDSKEVPGKYSKPNIEIVTEKKVNPVKSD
jgi:hypothetical protein